MHVKFILSHTCKLETSHSKYDSGKFRIFQFFYVLFAINRFLSTKARKLYRETWSFVTIRKYLNIAKTSKCSQVIVRTHTYTSFYRIPCNQLLVVYDIISLQFIHDKLLISIYYLSKYIQTFPLWLTSISFLWLIGTASVNKNIGVEVVPIVWRLWQSFRFNRWRHHLISLLMLLITSYDFYVIPQVLKYVRTCRCCIEYLEIISPMTWK